MSAISFVAPEIGVPIAAAVGTAKATIGEHNYNRTRSAYTWTVGAVNGFSPIPPMITLLPLKIASFVILIIMFIHIFGMSAGKGIFAAYIGQAIIAMYASNWIVDKTLQYGLGI